MTPRERRAVPHSFSTVWCFLRGTQQGVRRHHSSFARTCTYGFVYCCWRRYVRKQRQTARLSTISWPALPRGGKEGCYIPSTCEQTSQNTCNGRKWGGEEVKHHLGLMTMAFEAPGFQGIVSRKVEQKTSLDFYITTTMEMPSFSSMTLSLSRDITYISFRPQVEDRGGVWSFFLS